MTKTSKKIMAKEAQDRIISLNSTDTRMRPNAGDTQKAMDALRGFSHPKEEQTARGKPISFYGKATFEEVLSALLSTNSKE